MPASRAACVGRSPRPGLAETAVTADNDLIQPALFIEEGIDEALPIAEMPAVSRVLERKPGRDVVC